MPQGPVAICNHVTGEQLMRGVGEHFGRDALGKPGTKNSDPDPVARTGTSLALTMDFVILVS